jgi:gluconate 2-dehydrogenase gamma chain
MSDDISRRDFFARTIVYGGAVWVFVNLPRPRALAAAAESAKPLVLAGNDWQTVEAITGRIIPTDELPGAIEAGCVNFIDKALANEDAALKAVYQAGLAGIEAVSRGRFGKPFTALVGKDQDQVLAALESGKAKGWPGGEVGSQQFFETVRMHTIWGFLADPRHGGNRDYVGWKVVGYPGPRHHQGGYTPEQMLGKAKIKTIWGEET